MASMNRKALVAEGRRYKLPPQDGRMVYRCCNVQCWKQCSIEHINEQRSV
jgi:hypothetical protein